MDGICPGWDGPAYEDCIGLTSVDDNNNGAGSASMTMGDPSDEFPTLYVEDHLDTGLASFYVDTDVWGDLAETGQRFRWGLFTSDDGYGGPLPMLQPVQDGDGNNIGGCFNDGQGGYVEGRVDLNVGGGNRHYRVIVWDDTDGDGLYDADDGSGFGQPVGSGWAADVAVVRVEDIGVADHNNPTNVSFDSGTPVYVPANSNGQAVVDLAAAYEARLVPDPYSAGPAGHIVWNVQGSGATSSYDSNFASGSPVITLTPTGSNNDYTLAVGFDTNGNGTWDEGDNMTHNMTVHVMMPNGGVDEPGSFAANPWGADQAGLTWTGSTDSGTYYVVERDNFDDTTSSFCVYPGTGWNDGNDFYFADAGLKPGAHYDYRIEEVADGTSLSNAVTASVEMPALAVQMYGGTVTEGEETTLYGYSNAAGATFSWDLNNDGLWDATGDQATFSAAGLTGPTSATVKLRATVTGTWGTTSTSAYEAVNVLDHGPEVTGIVLDGRPSGGDGALHGDVQRGGHGGGHRRFRSGSR